MYHKVIFITPTSWLDDPIITAAQFMLKQQYPSIDGFQPSVPSLNILMIPPKDQFMQIIHVNKNHWIPLLVACSMPQNI